METILFFAVIILFVMVFNLSGKVTHLEQQLQNKTTQKPAQVFSEEVSQSEAVSETEPVHVPGLDVAQLSVEEPLADIPSPVEKKRASVAIPKAPAAPSFDIIAWFKEDFLIKFGGILLFLGIGWFVTYAFVEGWVSPGMRIVLGLLLGLMFYGIAMWRMSRARVQGLVINALGTGTILLSVYAGRLLFDLSLLTGPVALMLMMLAISYTVYTGVRFESEKLVIAAALAGFLVPFFSNMEQPTEIGLFSYLLVTSALFVWVVSFTGWSRIVLILLVGIQFFLFSASLRVDGADEAVLIIFAGLFALLFYGAGLMSTLARMGVVSIDVSIVAFNALMLWYWIHTLLPEVAQAPAAFVVTAIAAGTAFFILEVQRSQQVAMLHAAMAVLFGFVGTAFLFNGFSLALAYTLEVGFLMLLSLRLNFRDEIIYIVTGLFALPGLTSLALLGARSWRDGWVHPEAFALWVFVMVTAAVSYMGLVRGRNTVANIFATMSVVYMTLTITKTIDTLGFSSDYESIVLSLVLGMLATIGVLMAMLLGIPAYIRKLMLAWFTLAVIISLAAFDNDLWEGGFVSLGFATWLVLFVCAVSIMTLAVRVGLNLVRRFAAVVALGYLYATPLMLVEAKLSEEVGVQVLVCIYAAYTLFFCYTSLEFIWSNKRLRMALLSSVLPAMLSLSTIFSDLWRDGISHMAFVALVMLSFISIALTTLAVRSRLGGDKRSVLPAFEKTFFVGSAIYVVSLVWQTTHGLFGVDSFAVMVSLFIYAMIGLALYIVGRSKDDKALRYAGMTFLVGVILRLLLVDVWQMEIWWRIFTFVGVGVLFIATSFLETGIIKKQDERLSDNYIE